MGEFCHLNIAPYGLSGETVWSLLILVEHTRSFDLGVESLYGSNNGSVVSRGSTNKSRVQSVVVILA